MALPPPGPAPVSPVQPSVRPPVAGRGGVSWPPKGLPAGAARSPISSSAASRLLGGAGRLRRLRQPYCGAIRRREILPRHPLDIVRRHFVDVVDRGEQLTPVAVHPVSAAQHG